MHVRGNRADKNEPDGNCPTSTSNQLVKMQPLLEDGRVLFFALEITRRFLPPVSLEPALTVLISYVQAGEKQDKQQEPLLLCLAAARRKTRQASGTFTALYLAAAGLLVVLALAPLQDPGPGLFTNTGPVEFRIKSFGVKMSPPRRVLVSGLQLILRAPGRRRN